VPPMMPSFILASYGLIFQVYHTRKSPWALFSLSNQAPGLMIEP